MKHSIFNINLRNCNPIVCLHAHNMQISFASNAQIPECSLFEHLESTVTIPSIASKCSTTRSVNALDILIRSY